MNEELDSRRLAIETDQSTFRSINGLAGELGVDRKVARGLVMEFADANKDQFRQFAEERDC